MKFFGEELLLDEIRGIKYSLAYSIIIFLPGHSLAAVPCHVDEIRTCGSIISKTNNWRWIRHINP